MVTLVVCNVQWLVSQCSVLAFTSKGSVHQLDTQLNTKLITKLNTRLKY